MSCLILQNAVRNPNVRKLFLFSVSFNLSKSFSVARIIGETRLHSQFGLDYLWIRFSFVIGGRWYA